jgi:hypothetical protein
MKYYTGIGSRSTPLDIQDTFTMIAKFLAIKGYTLRSGGAKGADQSFERGCDILNASKEIYLPWKNFEGSNSDLIVTDSRAFEIAKCFHGGWDRLSDGGKKLQARNTHQVLGKDLITRSEFVICWTPGASGSGGTGQAIRIAKYYNVPIYDVGSSNSPLIYLMEVLTKHFDKE